MNGPKRSRRRLEFYWYREPSRLPAGVEPYITVVKVIICEESFVAELGKDGANALEPFKGEWLGPLDIPR